MRPLKIELIGKHLSTLLNSKEDQDNFYKHRNLLLDVKYKNRIECKFTKKDKTTFFVLMESTVVEDENKQFKYFLTTITDISDKKELEINLESSLAQEKN